MATASLYSFNGVTVKLSVKWNARHPFQVKAQRFGDEGRLNNNRNNVVDANMSVLRERIKKVEMKERLERCCRSSCDDNLHGWNYASGSGYDVEHYDRHKREQKLKQLAQLVTLAGATVGLTCLSGTVFLCILSMLVHISQ